MDVRKAVPADLDAVMRIYRAAQTFMIRSGNPTQWGRFYPPRELVAADIAREGCFVLTENGAVHGVFALCFDGDPAYRVIEDGAWPDDEPYIAIHRVAGDGEAHGVFRAAADYCAALCDHLRIDTHADNRVMQRKIEAYGFRRCGTVFAEDGTPRIAYQWDRKETGGFRQ